MTISAVQHTPPPGIQIGGLPPSIGDTVEIPKLDPDEVRCAKLYAKAQPGVDYVWGKNQNAPHNGMIAITDLGRDLVAALEICGDDILTQPRTGGKDPAAAQSLPKEAQLETHSRLHNTLRGASPFAVGTGVALLAVSPIKPVGAVLAAAGAAALVASFFVD